MPGTSPAALLARMADLDTQDIEDDFISMFYGPMGSGKTTLTQGLAQALRGDGRILFGDSSNGWVSLRNFEGLRDNTQRIRVKDYADLAGLSHALSSRAKGYEDFSVIVLDEASSMATVTLDETIKSKYGRLDADVEGKDYRPSQLLFMDALKRLHDTEGLHVLLTAHDRQEQDHRKVKVTMPGFSAALRKEITKLMHVVGYVSSTIEGTLAAPEYNRQVQCQPSKLIEAKSRIGGMPLITDFEDVVERIADWVQGDISHDLTLPEPNVNVAEDKLPEEGVPVADVTTEDDEPVYVGEPE